MQKIFGKALEPETEVKYIIAIEPETEQERT